MRSAIPLFATLLALIFPMPIQADDEPVSRLPRISDEAADPLLKQMFDDIRARGGQILNLHLTQGHAPPLAKARRDLAYALRFETVLQPLLRELAILRAGQILGSQYEHNQHVPLARACGATDAQLAALANWRSTPLFDDKQRALLTYVDAIVERRGEVDDATFNALTRHFTPREVVEITVATTAYVATGLFTKALQIKIETDGRSAIRGRC